MPQVPLLPPDQLAQAQATGGLSPANFLMAAADLHNSGQLSAPVPAGKPLQTGPKRQPRKLKVIK
jgi:hypothetical protein